MAESLASIVLPEGSRHRRDHMMPAGYEDGFDFRTLCYDAVALPDRAAVWLFCPKLANFARLLRRGDLRIDGRAVRPSRIRRFERYDIAEIPWESAAGVFSLDTGDWRAEVCLSHADRETFAGRRVLLTLSKNNELRWIRDWALFHVREHGADALLLYDNGSEAYGVSEIESALAGIDGLRTMVLSADFPYGPRLAPPKGKRRRFRASFLQAALLNLARFRYLAGARSVLQCDVDELVVRRGPATVFEAAEQSRAGFLRIPGEWRFPARVEGMPLHADHYLRGPEPKTCPPKYCVVPEGPMRNKSWSTHGLRGLLFPGRHIDSRFGFLHCYGISDFWKGRPTGAAAEAGIVDVETRDLLARAFS